MTEAEIKTLKYRLARERGRNRRLQAELDALALFSRSLSLIKLSHIKNELNSAHRVISRLIKEKTRAKQR